MIECNGKPIRKNQDRILRLLLDEKDVLLDFTCDHSYGSKNVQLPQGLSKGDARMGKDRIALMKDKDHLLKIRSLLKYHMTGIRLLGMCAAGNNQAAKEACAGIPEISLQQCIDNFLDLDRNSNGVSDKDLDPDVIYYVQRPYVRLITNVYLDSNLDPSILKGSQRWWPEENSTSSGADDLKVRDNVLEEFIRCLSALCNRISKLNSLPYSITGFQDEFGSDLSLHTGIALQIIAALSAFLSKEDGYTRGSHSQRDRLFETLITIMPLLNKYFQEMKLPDHVAALLALKYALEKHHFPGIILSGGLIKDEDETIEDDETRDAKIFLDGWSNFTARVALELKVDLDPEKSTIRSIRDLAPVFGSKKTLGNTKFEHLKTLMTVVSNQELDSSLQLTCLRIIIAVFYLQPSNKVMSHDMRDVEWKSFLRNGDPRGSALSQLQDVYAENGAVQAVLNCVNGTESSNIREALRLGAIMLSNGSRSVQNQFYGALANPSSQSFFEKLRGILQNGVNILKEASTNEAKNNTRVDEIEQIFFIFKFMKRLFMGQNERNQELFRGMSVCSKIFQPYCLTHVLLTQYVVLQCKNSIV